MDFYTVMGFVLSSLTPPIIASIWEHFVHPLLTILLYPLSNLVWLILLVPSVVFLEEISHIISAVRPLGFAIQAYLASPFVIVLKAVFLPVALVICNHPLALLVVLALVAYALVEVMHYLHHPKHRKPFDSAEECVFCVEPLAKWPTVWCMKTCGNSVHASCMKRHVTTSNTDRCIFCREEWICTKVLSVMVTEAIQISYWWTCSWIRTSEQLWQAV